MSFAQTFCASPWLHMRITNSGTYKPCRWMSNINSTQVSMDLGIKTVSPLTYFQTHMAPLRAELLQGNSPAMCNNCSVMEQHAKPSGRQRQLLKVGIQGEYFEKSLASSPLKPAFDYSNNNTGHTTRTVTDWQIDLGNYCNGACVFCTPESSSSLATEFKKLGLIDQTPPPAWCDDPVLLEKFVNDLAQTTDLHYLHFLGGETVITPGFKKILTALVDRGIASQITIGFTTNLTVWSDPIVELLKQFYQVNMGMSIETLTPVNDYVRYPSQIESVKQTLDRWVCLGREQNWLMQLRITPTCLSVHELHTVYDYAWQHMIAVESCNFIEHPEVMRMSVLPKNQRDQAVQTLKTWIDQHPIADQAQIINTRDPNIVREQIVQDAKSYLAYLESAADESARLPELVAYIKKLQSNRGNDILTYIPQYENLFRSAGY
jgi:sulfatase maturation enzyme AslB (radical SAM superfamily)